MPGNVAVCRLICHNTLSVALGCDNPPCLYFADSESIKSVQINNHSHITTVASGLSGSEAVEVDVRENMVYWSDNKLHAILRKNLSSGHIDYVVTENLGEVYGLAVEWGSGLLYWTDYLYERIEVARLNGSLRKTLIEEKIYNPRSIVVDPNAG